jgi:hypothetical protein
MCLVCLFDCYNVNDNIIKKKQNFSILRSVHGASNLSFFFFFSFSSFFFYPFSFFWGDWGVLETKIYHLTIY